MTLINRTKPFLMALCLGSVLFSTTASADYRLTAFSDTLAFEALLVEDGRSAGKIFELVGSYDLDYFEANNLCVTEILLEDYAAAISACSAALEKSVLSRELSSENKNRALASIHSNLGVAKALNGDSSGANGEFEMALTLNALDRNASTNYELISTNLIAEI